MSSVEMGNVVVGHGDQDAVAMWNIFVIVGVVGPPIFQVGDHGVAVEPEGRDVVVLNVLCFIGMGRITVGRVGVGRIGMSTIGMVVVTAIVVPSVVVTRISTGSVGVRDVGVRRRSRCVGVVRVRTIRVPAISTGLVRMPVVISTTTTRRGNASESHHDGEGCPRAQESAARELALSIRAIDPHAPHVVLPTPLQGAGGAKT